MEYQNTKENRPASALLLFKLQGYFLYAGWLLIWL
jgi:hypothetical protein